MSEKAVRVTVHGKVQGVNFRSATQEQAERLGVRGWVQNRPDDTVAGLFVGDPEAVDRLVQWCHQGPSTAEVEKVDVEAGDPSEAHTGFESR